MRYVSPTGSAIVGTWDVVPATAVAFDYDADGTPVYEGKSELFWDDQRTIKHKKGGLTYVDENGDLWAWSDLSPETADDDETESEEA